MVGKPSFEEAQKYSGRKSQPRNRVLSPAIFSSLVAAFLITTASLYLSVAKISVPSAQRIPINAQDILNKCANLRRVPGPPSDFFSREVSDRFEPGTNATLVRNCTIFTGERNGTVIINGDIFFDKGIVKGLGKVSRRIIDTTPNLTIIEANGAWVTPGLVDLHSHIGLLSAPLLNGAIDVNSRNGPVLPWLRSIDGFNTHDEAFQLAISGGVTSAQILPGSGNAIGGQAFMVKLRKTSERSPSSMIIEPPHSLNDIKQDPYSPTRWRHMKQACGENLRRYGNRMDSMWSFRSAYNEARKVRDMQDAYCAKAEAGLWESLVDSFPESYQWEMLVDVLRGKVKIANHCYEAVDLDDIVRLTNEFGFPIASFHHASEAYLVPQVLKRTWGGTPAIAIFATNHRYKRESFRGSEFAARILSDEGIPVVMKSDHPVIDSRYLVHEAQQAHYFSLPPNLALASVTSIPASAAGLGHRIGHLFIGSDADVVLWDSHPLQLGATPRKVWIDGILQIPVPPIDKNIGEVVVGKGKDGEEWREIPEVPSWDTERRETLKWDGLPPLRGRKTGAKVMFRNVKKVWTRDAKIALKEVFNSESFAHSPDGSLGTVVVENGKITCAGASSCLGAIDNVSSIIDLRGGSISPALMSYGSPLGLEEIASEPSTGNGASLDALKADIPKVLDDVGGVVRAGDALMFGTRNALIAHRSGITLATSSLARSTATFGPEKQLIAGLSVTFRTGSSHAMERGAIVQDITALHVVLGRSHPNLPSSASSVSTQMATLRRLLYGWESRDHETGAWFKKAAEGIVPLIIDVDSADIMASLLILKVDVEDKLGSRMRMAFSGAAEAHLLAREISDNDVGVILNPIRQFPAVWDKRRILPGPPLTNHTTLVTLLKSGVVVGLGVPEAWQARNTASELKLAALESNGWISEHQAYALVTTDLEDLLGIRGIDEDTADLVATEGGSILDQSSKVVAIISPSCQTVDVF